MKIEDVMTRRVVAARADTDLAHVARLMWDNDCGCVPVVDAEDHVVGILTDRDVCMGAHFSGLPLRELRAGGSMATDVFTCRPKDAPATVVKAMGARRVRCAVVTDGAGTLLGLVALADLLAAAGRAPAREKRALQGSVLEALAAITALPLPEVIVPARPAKKRAAAPKAKPRKTSRKATKASPKKRARR